MLTECPFQDRAVGFEIEWFLGERAVCELHAYGFKDVHAGYFCSGCVQARPDRVRSIVLCA